MLLFSLSQKENSVSVLGALIKTLNINVSSETIKSCLHDHPDYPSLLSLSDCLTEWKIPNNAYHIDLCDYIPDDLSFPFVAHLEKTGQFILVKGINSRLVTYTDEKDNNAVMPESAFLEQWGGVILHAEPTPHSGETDFKMQHFKGILNQLRGPALIASVLSFILYVFFQHSTSWVFIALSLFTLVGLIASVLLLVHGINASNPFVRTLCSLGEKNDCNAILKSKEAKVTEWLSWSEVGFFYFSGSLLSLLLVNNAVPFLAILNICCLPYTIWSVRFQYKTKNWCVICCIVQAILWLQFVIFAVGIGYSLPVPEITTLLGMLFCFFATIAVWAFVKPFMLKAEQLGPLKQQLKKFKYNSDLFNRILTAQTHFLVPNDIMPIVLGNLEAENIITMISNPFCEPCVTTHRILDQWLKTRDDIQVKIVFTTANHDDDPKTRIARHLIALSLLEDKRKVEQALNDWYNSAEKNYDIWAKKYPIQINGEMEMASRRQKEWCELTEVTFTPTILVNGYKLPEPYILDDIRFLMN